MGQTEIYVSCPRCEAEVEIECDVDVVESYYHHGLTCVSHEVLVVDLPPDQCPEGCEWTEEERKVLEASIEKAAEDWRPYDGFD